METDRNSGSSKQGATSVQPSSPEIKKAERKKEKTRFVTLIHKKNLSCLYEKPIILKVTGEGPKYIHGHAFSFEDNEFEYWETKYDKNEYVIVSGKQTRIVKKYEKWKYDYKIWKKWYLEAIKNAEEKAKEWVYEQVVEYVLNHPKPESPFASMIKPNKAKAKRGEQ
jgi:hypothetical protein